MESNCAGLILHRQKPPLARRSLVYYCSGVHNKTIAMTCRYAHLTPTYQLAAVERLAEINRAIQAGKPEGPTDTKTDTSILEPIPAGLERAEQIVLLM